jgi:hypothetical protein
MADGTIRFTVDVDPPYRETALKAFSQPGTACVLAVLTKEVAKKEMVKAEEKKADRCPQAIEYHEKHGKWPSNTANEICKEGNFYHYINDIECAVTVIDYESANIWLKAHCDEISSKSELDTNHDALTTFLGMLADYRKFVQDNK